MGTHPIFESDFDCLTETRLIYKALAFQVPVYEPKLSVSQWWSSVIIIIFICASIFVAFIYWHYKRAKKDYWPKQRYRAVSNCYDHYQVPLNDINENVGWGKATGRHSVIGLSASQPIGKLISTIEFTDSASTKRATCIGK